jgi:predicted nucleic acid-binding protein
MTTAVDTSVLLDLIARESEHQDAAATALAKARKKGSIIVCEVVYAELAAAFKGEKKKKVDAFLNAAGITLSRSPEAVLADAGKLWQGYRDRGGPRIRILPDFLVGSHALSEAHELLTRDRGFFRDSFKKLRVVDPSKA